MSGKLRAAAASAIALVALVIAGQGSARAEMVYRMATMGEPKSLDPHLVSGTWENYIVGDAFLGRVVNPLGQAIDGH